LSRTMADSTALKEEGNGHFKAGRYAAAVESYTKSLEQEPAQHLVLSNRSAAYLKLGGAAEQSLMDAERCVELAPSFAKGYSRQAAALQALKRWEDAIKICENGMQAAPDDALKKMLSEVRSRHFMDKLQGMWHGKVSDELGGYDQEMEFMEGNRVQVAVFGRSVVGTCSLDCDPDPHNLTIQVPMPDAPPGMPPPPPVPYIVRLDDAGLHLCCPAGPHELRPMKFAGPGYCHMVRGKLAMEDSAAEMASLTEDEKLLLCAKEFQEALPEQKLEDLMPNDSEEVGREKLMAQVKFESSMFAVKNKFGDNLMTTVLEAAKGDGPVPACLAKSSELRGLREKLVRVELIPPSSPQTSSAPTPAAPPKAHAPPSSATPTAPPRADAEKGGSAAPAPQAPPAVGGSSWVITAALAVSAVAVVAGVVVWQKRKR